MVTARNVIIVTVTLAVISIVSACISLMQPPDSGGLASDSYGTRARGQRGLFETLEELGVPVERSLVPPTATLRNEQTLVFWGPDRGLVWAEPVYLRRVAEWVRQGGRVVVAPARQLFGMPGGGMPPMGAMEEEPKTILQELGVEGVSIDTVNIATLATDAEASADTASNGDSENGDSESQDEPTVVVDVESETEDDFEAFSEMWAEAFADPVGDPTDLEAEWKGDWGEWTASVENVAVAEATLHAITETQGKPTAEMTVRGPHGETLTLLQSYAVGKGTVVVVSDPELFSNRFLGRADNAVLAAQLLAGSGGTVVFDEFYHGLTIRGNPLWLMTRQPYSAIGLSLLVITGLWVWRQAVSLGPALAAQPVSRRSLAEYVDAMAHFFQRGKSTNHFVLREVRDGVLWTFRNRLGLSPGRETPEAVTAALARRSPFAAERVEKAIREADGLLQSGPFPADPPTVAALRKLADCL